MHNYTEYFKNQKGFTRLLEGLLKKYQSLGSFSGVIKITNLNKEEAKVLSRFLGVTLNEGEDISISVKNFLKIMSYSKFADFDINILVKEYFNKDLISNKETRLQNIQKETEFYQEFLHENTIGSNWLKYVIVNKNEVYRLIHKRYLQNKTNLKKELVNILNLINNLPEKKILLPIYAAKYTKDPHYLDLDGNHSILFFYALSFLEKCDYPLSREEKIKLLDRYNIEIDNFSNFVITYNLETDKDYVNKFSQNNESLILNMQNIMNIDKINGKHKKVFIFENPSILSEIMLNNLDITVIITSGFINLSVYLLLDKLVLNDNKLYYNGDFDPEGLIIANKLKEKYHNNLEFICYERDDYDNCLSKNIISKNSLSKLNKINNKELDVIKNLLVNNKLAVYQENNKERIIKVIKSII